ncbi:uncharacterized protein LOC106159938 [Lingula anatina]|uniref:Uncharacterized protein LOC106159938 n=1 Tax=Lingula anatina TaxID=7574 RepID=A0A1S3I1Y9_LINAN|nr:uncharacterized protein LOC106159938 [Lingula anatina]|eukprot:XP_013391846.1 uncharacterized protein LOC106159938 [Lingula anatina]
MVQKVANYTELLREQGRGAYNDAKNILSKLTADAKTAIESTLQQLQGIRENFYKAFKSMFDNFFGFFKGIFGKRATRALWAKFVDSLQSVFAKFKGKYEDLAAFVKEKLGDGVEEARGHLENVKLMTKTVLDNAQEAGEAKLKELQEVVKAYKNDLGDLWGQLETAIKNIG